MPPLSREEVDRDVMAWWDQLQSRPKPELKRQEITVEVTHQTFTEKEPRVSEVPQDKIEK